MIIPEKTLSHLRAINYICLHSEDRRIRPWFVSVLELPQVCDQRLPMCPPWSACKGHEKWGVRRRIRNQSPDSSPDSSFLHQYEDGWQCNTVIKLSCKMPPFYHLLIKSSRRRKDYIYIVTWGNQNVGIIRFCPYRAWNPPLYSVTQGAASLALG